MKTQCRRGGGHRDIVVNRDNRGLTDCRLWSGGLHGWKGTVQHPIYLQRSIICRFAFWAFFATHEHWKIASDLPWWVRLSCLSVWRGPRRKRGERAKTRYCHRPRIDLRHGEERDCHLASQIFPPPCLPVRSSVGSLSSGATTWEGRCVIYVFSKFSLFAFALLLCFVFTFRPSRSRFLFPDWLRFFFPLLCPMLSFSSLFFPLAHRFFVLSFFSCFFLRILLGVYLLPYQSLLHSLFCVIWRRHRSSAPTTVCPSVAAWNSKSAMIFKHAVFEGTLFD